MNTRLLTLTAAVAAALAMAACNKPPETRANADGVVAQTESKARELGNDAAKGMEQAKDATREAAQDMAQAGKNAGEQISDKVSDAVITTTVKAELVKDPDLSALKINVDTAAGRVVLQGSAPSSQARDHAAMLARAVKGVVSVDNQLKVEAGKG